MKYVSVAEGDKWGSSPQLTRGPNNRPVTQAYPTSSELNQQEGVADWIPQTTGVLLLFTHIPQLIVPIEVSAVQQKSNTMSLNEFSAAKI